MEGTNEFDRTLLEAYRVCGERMELVAERIHCLQDAVDSLIQGAEIFSWECLFLAEEAQDREKELGYEETRLWHQVYGKGA